VNRYGVARADVDELFATLGEPAYRAGQLWDGLYTQRAPLADITTLSRSLRSRVADALPLAFEPVYQAIAVDGLTTKWLWQATRDGVQVETVLMRSAQRATVCVSSQAGCAMACTFCATGQAGLDRHLDAGEIVEQVVRAQHGSPQRVSNVVFMGMGEPLANYDATWAAVERLHHDVGLSARHLTVSTVGVVPGMRRLASESLPVTLAVSLHAPDDALRETLVPLNRRYPIADVLDAAADVAGAHGRRVSFEYAAIAGINDRPEQAEALGRLLARWPGVGGAHVNVIPLNPTAGFPGRASSPARLRAFADGVRRFGVNTTIRRNRGVDIDAACGQLRTRLAGHTDAAVPTPAVRPARMGS